MQPTNWFETQTILAFIVVSAFCALCLLWSIYPPTLTAEQKDVAMSLMTGLGVALGMVMQYFMNKRVDQ